MNSMGGHPEVETPGFRESDTGLALGEALFPERSERLLERHTALEERGKCLRFCTHLRDLLEERPNASRVTGAGQARKASFR